jgi:hypothetical protein
VTSRFQTGLPVGQRESATEVVPTLINTDNFPSIAAAGAVKFPVYAAHMRALYATSRDRIRNAFTAGVAICTGTDAGGSLPHGLIRDEIRALIGAGIRRTRSSPRRVGGAASGWGCRGWSKVRLADFVVLDHDPRVEPATMLAPVRVVLRAAVVGD